MVKKIKIETTPTSSESEESEQETEFEVLQKVANGPQRGGDYIPKSDSKKSKTLDYDDLKNSVLSLVKGSLRQAEQDEQPKPKQKRKVSEEVLKRLELAREKRKKNHEEHKEEVAKMLLKQKGYNVSKYQDEEKEKVKVENVPVSKPVSKPVVKEVYEVKKFETVEKKQEPVYQTNKIPLKSSNNIITTAKTILPTIKPTSTSTPTPRKFSSMFD